MLLSLIAADASRTFLLKNILLGRGLTHSGEDSPSEVITEGADTPTDTSDMTEVAERAAAAETAKLGSCWRLAVAHTAADSASSIGEVT